MSEEKSLLKVSKAKEKTSIYYNNSHQPSVRKPSETQTQETCVSSDLPPGSRHRISRERRGNCRAQAVLRHVSRIHLAALQVEQQVMDEHLLVPNSNYTSAT